MSSIADFSDKARAEQFQQRHLNLSVSEDGCSVKSVG